VQEAPASTSPTGSGGSARTDAAVEIDEVPAGCESARTAAPAQSSGRASRSGEFSRGTCTISPLRGLARSRIRPTTRGTVLASAKSPMPPVMAGNASIGTPLFTDSITLNTAATSIHEAITQYMTNNTNRTRQASRLGLVTCGDRVASFSRRSPPLRQADKPHRRPRAAQNLATLVLRRLSGLEAGRPSPVSRRRCGASTPRRSLRGRPRRSRPRLRERSAFVGSLHCSPAHRLQSCAMVSPPAKLSNDKLCCMRRRGPTLLLGGRRTPLLTRPGRVTVRP
jgi:hypothetical protein